MAYDVYPKVNFNLGRPLKFTAKQLAEKFAEYVDWCINNPIVVKSQSTQNGNNGWNNEGVHEELKPRLISIDGFCVFVGESRDWWRQLNGSKKEDFSTLKDRIRVYCEGYQKEMASSGVFKENIIARLLGLADKAQVDADVKTEFKFKFGE